MFRLNQLPYIGTSLLVIAVLVGCGSKEPAPPPAPAEPVVASANPKPGEAQLPPLDVLYEQWQTGAMASDEELDVEALSVVAGLINEYEEGDDLFFNMIESPEAEPRMKMLATMSMGQWVFPEDTARLVEITAAENDPTTRACAAHLLSSIPEPEPAGKERLYELMEDKSQQVRVAVILAMAAKEDPVATVRLLPLWEEDTLTPQQRTSLLMTLPAADPAMYQKIYLDAVQMQELSPELRLSLIEQLSLIGGEEVQGVLQKIGESDPNNEVRSMAEGAAAALRMRQEAPLDQGAAN